MADKDKVKVAMFLSPEVAQAIKVQAARQRTGVSDAVTQHYLCAHCGEPLLDEIMVGVPRPVGPEKSRESVMYHKNRDACRTAAGGRISFLATCPKCGVFAHQSFVKAELRASLQSRTVRFYCSRCDHNWMPAEADTHEIAKIFDPS